MSSPESADDKNYSVLIIEDDPLILDILVFKFGKNKWQVSSAMDGEKGLQKVESEKPQIILLDILLPGISGYDVLEKLKSDGDSKDIPVLVLSNFGQKEEIEKSISMGAVDHMVKANVILDEVVENSQKIIEGTYQRS